MPSNVISISVDREAFKAAVQKYLDTAPIMATFDSLKSLQWPSALQVPQIWTTIATISKAVSVVTAAVEVAKQKIIQEQDPDGSKGASFDKEIALSTAVEILGTLIHWNGRLAPIVNKLWAPFLNLLVSIAVNGRPKDWLATALDLLKNAA